MTSLTTNKLTVSDFLAWQKSLQEMSAREKTSVYVCDGTGCRALGSQKVLAEIRKEIKRQNLEVDIKVVGTGCPGYCEFGPLLTIFPEGISYQKLKLEDVPILSKRPFKNTRLFRTCSTLTRKQAKKSGSKKIFLSSRNNIEDYLQVMAERTPARSKITSEMMVTQH